MARRPCHSTGTHHGSPFACGTSVTPVNPNATARLLERPASRLRLSPSPEVRNGAGPDAWPATRPRDRISSHSNRGSRSCGPRHWYRRSSSALGSPSNSLWENLNSEYAPNLFNADRAAAESGARFFAGCRTGTGDAVFPVCCGLEQCLAAMQHHQRGHVGSQPPRDIRAIQAAPAHGQATGNTQPSWWLGYAYNGCIAGPVHDVESHSACTRLSVTYLQTIARAAMMALHAEQCLRPVPTLPPESRRWDAGLD